MSITDPQLRLSALKQTARSPAVAGMFYPGHPDELRVTVREMLDRAACSSPVPKVIISPHAGYVYSGDVAARAFSTLGHGAKYIRRVVLLGPAHRVRLNGIAIPSVASFETPLGHIKLAQSALKRIESLPQVTTMDLAHKQEHSLEVQLPFLQEALADFRLIPMVVGNATPSDVAEVLDILWGGKETLVVISSDLSHYHEYQESRRRDETTSGMIENFQYDQLTPQNACGAHPLRGLLMTASRREMKIRRQFLCNSGDTAGNKDRVVGYGSWCLYEAGQLMGEQRERLAEIARQSIRQGLESGSPFKPDPGDFPAILLEKSACFVTIKKMQKLRGCIGSLQASMPLVNAVADSAYKAAFKDPRFPPLTAEELEQIEISISVLSPREEIEFKSDAELLGILRPGIDGLVIQNERRSATFLPSVWEQIPDKSGFLAQLKVKAGIRADQAVARAWRYSAEYID